MDRHRHGHRHRRGLRLPDPPGAHRRTRDRGRGPVAGHPPAPTARGLVTARARSLAQAAHLGPVYGLVTSQSGSGSGGSGDSDHVVQPVRTRTTYVAPDTGTKLAEWSYDTVTGGKGRPATSAYSTTNTNATTALPAETVTDHEAAGPKTLSNIKYSYAPSTAGTAQAIARIKFK
ncbi:hypothetical protein [Streptomyces sp. NPDC004042]|uniref:hypothetical protein n=1 Tax=Streptomyces sp. NPDC004042 TaxID=3154451 RepID=UPI00339F41B3